MGLKHLVLLGTGNAHLHFMQSLTHSRRADTKVTLVSPHAHVLSQDMLAGLVAGQYTPEQCSLDLQALIKASGVVHASASCTGIDARNQTVQLLTREGEPAQLHYQLLSLDTGPVTNRDALEHSMPGARGNALFMRPLETFAKLWPQLLALGQTRALSIAVIGADSLATELAFAIQHALPGSRVTLVTGGREPADDATPAVRERVLRRLKLRHITVLKEACVGMDAQQVRLASGATLACDAPIVATDPQAPPWLQDSGLALDEAGFVRVNAFQQSSSHGDVFASGDLTPDQEGMNTVRVRRGLEFNLRAVLADEPLKETRIANRTWRALSCGEPWAIASWGQFSVEGRWVWRLKNRADRRHLEQVHNAA